MRESPTFKGAQAGRELQETGSAALSLWGVENTEVPCKSKLRRCVWWDTFLSTIAREERQSFRAAEVKSFWCLSCSQPSAVWGEGEADVSDRLFSSGRVSSSNAAFRCF